jgi:hypothetical protein
MDLLRGHSVLFFPAYDFRLIPLIWSDIIGQYQGWFYWVMQIPIIPHYVAYHGNPWRESLFFAWNRYYLRIH